MNPSERCLGRFSAPYLEEIEEEARTLCARFGGQIEIRQVSRGRRDSAWLYITREPRLEHGAPSGLAGWLDVAYAGHLVTFRPARAGYFWAMPGTAIPGGPGNQ